MRRAGWQGRHLGPGPESKVQEETGMAGEGEVIGDEAKKKETEKDEDRKLVFSVYYQYQRQ